MPDHPFEQLGDQRFQQLSQALLTEQFPQLQCLPVAQPDGGRDALARLDGKEGLLVFQVKFARQPDRLEDPEKWVRQVLAGERAKIEQLRERGATQYYLLTNLSATAHLDRGSLDRVQGVLDELPLPATCWWRDDLNRRLEQAFDLKLSYPDIFTGPDFLRVLIERDGNSQDDERRRRALRAYLAEQHSRDREVRFKQADLSNDLLSVFIDVPAGIETSGSPVRTEAATEVHALLRRRSKIRRIEPPDQGIGRLEPAGVGAGTLLLDATIPNVAPRIVVEGAPGQGKSTVLQYVCQLHRMRLLDKGELSLVSEDHAKSPVRLPFRIDLRDLAQWLGGQDPNDKTRSELPVYLRTLEGFLAGQVTSSSGGAEFSVADVQAVVSESHILLALDGLDEVADATDRIAVIEAIQAGVDRLEVVAKSLLTVVTSRPASFVGTVGLPRKTFPVVRLQSITRSLIGEYAKKWMDARNLDKHEREELTTTLDAKLDQPHIRDLAHNPMQLAILLNLIHRRGPALPDQRTALYSSYMEQFLDREAEKSRAVRDHRNLLIMLHGHLAWLLHCQAERSAEGGRFTTDDIRKVTGDFLEKKGYDRDLFGDLFGGVIDRVGALVSRLQDTYEFEVQPLREFFASQYLYQTAPYSSAGEKKSGTKPERLDAIARHPYWLNVTRFYAGSYDVGELSSLADHLELLHEKEPWSTTAHPRMVAARLLADWTFQQDLTVQDRVVKLVKQDLCSKGSASQRYEAYSAAAELAVPEECGGRQISEQALCDLREERRSDRRYALASIVRAQTSDDLRRLQYWRSGFGEVTGEMRDLWIRSIYPLGLYHEVLAGDLGDLQEASDETLAAVLYAEQFEAFDSNPLLSRRAMEIVLSQPSIANPAGDTGHPLATLAATLFVEREEPSGRTTGMLEEALAKDLSSYSVLKPFFTQALETVQMSGVDWNRQMQPWEALVEAGRGTVGEHEAFDDLAVAAAGVTDRVQRGGGYADLFDNNAPLCQRTRHARMRSSDARWWKETLGRAGTPMETVRALALLFLWGKQVAIEPNRTLLRERLEALGDAEQERLVRLMQRARSVSRGRSGRIRWSGAAKPEDGTLFAVLFPRLSPAEANAIYESRRWFRGNNYVAGVLDVFFREELRAVKEEPNQWPTLIENVKRHYLASGWPADLFSYGFEGRPKPRSELPLSAATAVVKNAENYPLTLVSLAEARCLAKAQKNAASVAAVAERDNWFDY